MDWLATVLTSKNFLMIAVFVVVLVLLLAFLSRKGLFHFKNNVLSIGNDETNSHIVMRQIEYTKAELDSYFEELIKKNKDVPGFNKILALYSKELVYDVFVEAIAMNHITADDFYCHSKLVKMWAELQKQELSRQFTTQEFKQECFRVIKKIFTHLKHIRQYYEGKR